MCGSLIRPRWSVAGPGRPRNAPSWPAGPSTATAPPTPATSGDSGCTWCAPCTACLWAGRWVGAKTDERDVLEDLLATTPALASRPGRRTIIADKGYYGRHFEHRLAANGIDLLRPARKGEKPQAAARHFKPLRQIIESVNDTLKGQLDLELPAGRTKAGVCVRIAQRILALVAAIWHNDQAGAAVHRSLTAYDH